MKAYSDLPTLVTIKILKFAFSGVDGDLDMWKQALPLLSVCHDWRVYGKICLYRYAIVEVVDSSTVTYDFDFADHTDDESVSSSVNYVGNAVALNGNDSLRAYTNIKLIEKLGLQSMVKQLLFGEKRPAVSLDNRWDSIKAYIFILQALFHDLPEGIKLTNPFIKWFEL
ncbi:hypothetical protein IWW56_005626, partial [Coemansia sp. RSA 2131]